jgi:formiminoglutamate deiminase
VTRAIYAAAYAWLPPGEVVRDVVFDVVDGRFTSVRTETTAPPDAVRLPGVVLPGFANAHSHAFHRALRGVTHAGGGTFWTWREQMYAIAAVLDPDTYLELATAVFAEMALAGVTCIGEFHYVHHAPGGAPYDDPNAMGEALRVAAQRAGIRVTLLDTCYLAGGIGEPLSESQARFGDGDAQRWAGGVAALSPDETTRIGVAVHSVRAVPPPAIVTVADVARSGEMPLHIHVSEQPAENAACLAAYGMSPVELLAEHGAIWPRTTAVHATHLTPRDIELLGGARAYACFCPTTERDLADGIGPASELAAAGTRLTLGSDQHAVIDMIEEARALEMHERLRSQERGRLSPTLLTAALTSDGHASLGWPEAGRLEAAAIADMVAVRLDTVRTAGCDPAQVLLAATTADVDTVVVGGQVVVRDGVHVVGDVGALLEAAIARVTPQ